MTNYVNAPLPRKDVWINNYDQKPDDWYYEVACHKDQRQELVWSNDKYGRPMIERSQWKVNKGFYCPGIYIVNRWGGKFGDIEGAWQKFSSGYQSYLIKMPVSEQEKMIALGVAEDCVPSESDLRSKLYELPKARNALIKIFDADRNGYLDENEITQLRKAVVLILDDLAAHTSGMPS